MSRESMKDKKEAGKKGEPGMRLFVDDWRDITIALFLLTLVFAYDYQNPLGTVNYIMQALIAVGTALLVNRIVHKLAAREFGASAFYKLWMPGIVFAILLMLIGFKFPIVGLVAVQPFAFARWGFKSRKLSLTEEGLMGLVGPCSNIILAMLLRAFPGDIFSYMSFVSAYFAIFNLLPIKNFDGYKILVWKPWYWLFIVIICALLFFV